MTSELFAWPESAERLYELSMDTSFINAEGGDVTDYGLWFGSIDDAGKFFIMYEDSQGFVDVDEFDTADERDEAMATLLEEWEEWQATSELDVD